VQSGSGTLILTGNNTYSGGTTIRAGTLQIGSGGTTGSVLGNVTDNGSLAFDRSDSVAFGGAISGTGALVQSGSGTLTLTANNTYAGNTTINAGTLQIGNGGATGSITGNVTDNGTLAFDRSDSVTFGGAISGTGALVQLGSGILTLTGTNTYSGGTMISAGTIQVGNGGATGSILGNIADNGTLIFNRSSALSFGGVISGTGSVEQNGSGTTILSGINTYTGGTIVNAGTLTVNSAQALGLGNVQVNGGILRADPQPINVKGNYTQNAGGTLQLQVAGANPGQYDTLNVGGNAALGGTLQLLSLGFQPKAGNQLTLVTAGGVVSGRFAQFLNPFTTGPGFNTVDLVYGRNSVLLEFLNLTTPVPSPIPSPAPPPVIVTINFASFALTPNQLAAGTLVDQIQFNPKAADLISFLADQPASNLPGDLEKISPDGLTAFYEISFSNANIQRLNLEGRLDDLRSGSNGFSSNMKVNGASVNLDGKSSKSTVEQVLQPGPQNRWGVWVTGFGDFVNVDSDSNAKGYDFTTGGFSVGIDYRINDQLAIGAMGEYAHTWTSLEPSGDIDVDSGRGGVYATWFNHGIYLNGAIYGGHNSYSSSRSGLEGMASGGTGGAEFSTFISGGYDFTCGQLTVGPIAALQYTYVNIDSFGEHGSLAPLDIHSQSAESLRTDLGFRASYQWQVGKVLVEPSLRAAWEHEFKYSNLPITAGFAGIPGPSATFFGPSEGHDSAIVSAGVSVQWTPAIATYANYDGQLGRDRYDSNAVTGGVRISF
jgi:outer membrane autotransporter protein